jgi:hypothetical protein
MHNSESGAVDFLESLLKWASLAYALGFATVMLNTAHLGIPTLELIEPVQVWVGLPLAAIFWVVITLARYFRRRAAGMQTDLQLFDAQFQKLTDLAEKGELTAATAYQCEIMIRDLVAIPLGLKLVYRLQSTRLTLLSTKLASRLEPKTGAPEEVKKAKERQMRALLVLGKMSARMKKISVVQAFVSRVIIVAVVLVVASSWYIFYAYPRVPQSWGGGKPMIVSMLLADEKIPVDDQEASIFFPQGTTSSKSRRTQQLCLLLATENSYYVRLQDLKIVGVNSEAVGAVIFENQQDAKLLSHCSF